MKVIQAATGGGGRHADTCITTGGDGGTAGHGSINSSTHCVGNLLWLLT